MKILAMDTATAATTAAVLDTETEARFEARDDPAPGGRPGHAQKLLSLCERALRDAELTWDELDRLAVGIGPGTFTGLRIGIATAHALSQSTGIPLVGVPTLDSLALGAREPLGLGSDDSPVLAVIDARRGEAFAGGAGMLPAVIAPADLGRLITRRGDDDERTKTFAVGDGALKFRQELEAAGATVPADDDPVHRVDAVYHARLAAMFRPGNTTEVQPLYLRIPDAELTLRSHAPNSSAPSADGH